MPRPRSIPIQLDRPRNLRFTWGASAAFERETGQSILEMMASLGRAGDNPTTGIKFHLIQALLWAGLIHEEKTLTIDRVGEILDDLSGNGIFAGLASIQEKLFEAVLEGLGGDEAKKKLSEIQENLTEAESQKEATA